MKKSGIAWKWIGVCLLCIGLAGLIALLISYFE